MLILGLGLGAVGCVFAAVAVGSLGVSFQRMVAGSAGTGTKPGDKALSGHTKVEESPIAGSDQNTAKQLVLSPANPSTNQSSQSGTQIDWNGVWAAVGAIAAAISAIAALRTRRQSSA